ncbi:MAG: hypothetical protein AB7G13_11745 [Lautropia sp.]
MDDVRKGQWPGDPASRTRALVICGSPRNDGSCPGELSKTFRLARLIGETLESAAIEVDHLVTATSPESRELVARCPIG